MSDIFETIDNNTRKTILEEMEKSDEYLTSNDLPYKCKIIRYLKSYKNEIDKDKSIAQFIVNYQNEFTSYVGFINYLFEREFFGINYFSDGSIYLGEFNRNLINGLGLFIYNNKKNLYFGNFENFEKKGEGLYIWKTTNDLNSSLIDEDFTCFIGQIEDKIMIDGIYIKKINDEKIIYKGKFKNDNFDDEKGLLIDIKDNKFYIGKFKENKFIDGLISSYDNKENEFEIIETKIFNKDINDEDVKKILETNTKFIIQILEYDIFIQVHNYYTTMLAIANEYREIECFKNYSLDLFTNKLLSYKDFIINI
jgi:hypothetical protein